jgi:hypothetical protein
MSVKLDSVIAKFEGGSNEEVVEWIKKVELIASLQVVQDTAKFIPLFLHGAAFSVYDQLPADQKCDYEAVKKALISAFSLSKFQAYDRFRRRNLQSGESVDAYLADLRRLLSLMQASDESVLVCQFVAGLPQEVASQVKALQPTDAGVTNLLNSTKSVLADRDPAHFAAVANLAESL